MGLALDQLEFDERWLLLLLLLAGGDDDVDMTEEADGLVTEPFVVADGDDDDDAAIATLKFNESGLIAAPVPPLFDMSVEKGGNVVSSFELVFRGLAASSFLS